MSFQGFDYSTPPPSYCDCKKPDFDKSGICKGCGRPLQGITLDVKNVKSDLKFVLKQGEKQNG